MSSPPSSHHEKHDEKHLEDVNLEANRDGFDSVREKELMRRIDWRLMPILCVLYALSLIDRVNLGSARVEGLGVTLKFEGYKNNKYSIALLVFFIGYFLFELPSTLVLRRLQPRNFLTMIIVLWGATTLGMGFVHSWKTLAVCRAILGSLEAGFFPACVYLISSWYKRYEVQQRLSVFYMSSVLASGFASILAYGLARMNGLGGLEGWRWIFIMLGIITIIAGAIGWLLIVDFPDKATFLSEQERQHVIGRLNRDRGDGEHDPLTTKKVLSHLSDWKIWTLAVAFACSTMPAYSLAYFIPIILRGLGFSVALSNILVAPPYVLAVMLALTTSWWSDRIRLRTPFIIAHSLIAIAGFTIPQMPFIIGLLQNNIVSSSKRAVASGVQVAFGAIGGIAASTVYQEKDSPRYVNGLRATIIFHAGLIVTVCAVAVAFHIKNKELDRNAALRPQAELDAMSEKERALATWRHTI
ncbi:putative transporter C1002,16c OS=Schizosaccharomyces pombe (strain 972 / ATCC 24843) GN=SPAC1002.16c PE=3 SV=1 [Rhizoctonia solani AG-1 IB]|uniref:Putative transporter C1002,16c n=1 Tax=Thanatephorus cucumeris (strain AG1-IB / isolate 7/3/14) TaxID=1108050 RepID=A0A0B7F620_THACB|nr:putative transporter C1002,16c OS=Schizosaccharomyces pombe (strain 972 / ATCC 24843) GN=SPAC1002.16c PE=3 SV=1 [Rhizoctonia solani AG-1 IB]